MFLFVLVVLLAKVRKNGQSTKYLEAFPSAIVLVVAQSDEGKEQKKKKGGRCPPLSDIVSLNLPTNG
jgi:hypothetical protein